MAVGPSSKRQGAGRAIELAAAESEPEHFEPKALARVACVATPLRRDAFGQKQRWADICEDEACIVVEAPAVELALTELLGACVPPPPPAAPPALPRRWQPPGTWAHDAEASGVSARYEDPAAHGAYGQQPVEGPPGQFAPTPAPLPQYRGPSGHYGDFNADASCWGAPFAKPQAPLPFAAAASWVPEASPQAACLSQTRPLPPAAPAPHFDVAGPQRPPAHSSDCDVDVARDAGLSRDELVQLLCAAAAGHYED